MSKSKEAGRADAKKGSLTPDCNKDGGIAATENSPSSLKPGKANPFEQEERKALRVINTRRGMVPENARMRSPSSELSEEGDMLELMYDPVLNCYYDPHTDKYYELK